eukprot:1116777-Rhodomonas_salina.1
MAIRCAMPIPDELRSFAPYLFPANFVEYDKIIVGLHWKKLVMDTATKEAIYRRLMAVSELSPWQINTFTDAPLIDIQYNTTLREC